MKNKGKKCLLKLSDNQGSVVLGKSKSNLRPVFARGKTIMTVAVLLVLLVLAMPGVKAQVTAEESSPSNSEKVYYAVGIKPMLGGTLSGSDANGYIGIGAKGTLFREKFHVSAEFSTFEEFDLFSTMSQKQNHMNFLLGRYHNTDFLQFYAETGVGLIAGVRRGELLYTQCGDGWFSWCNHYYQKERYLTVGLPVQAGLRIIPLNFLAINFNLGIHINSVNTLGYGSLTLELGALR